MDKMRIALVKNDETKYVGHLDFGRALERALRRAKLPVAYSVGFNPHMKLSFGPALSVGVASDSEYIDVELTEFFDEADFGRILSAQLPPGLALVASRAVNSTASLAAALNLAEYQVKAVVEPSDTNLAAARTAAAMLQKDENVHYVRHTPKGQKTMDIKPLLAGGILVAPGDGCILVTFRLRMTAAGAVKPQEVMNVLMTRYAFPTGSTSYRRTVLQAQTASGIKEAFEI